MRPAGELRRDVTLEPIGEGFGEAARELGADVCALMRRGLSFAWIAMAAKRDVPVWQRALRDRCGLRAQSNAGIRRLQLPATMSSAREEALAPTRYTHAEYLREAFRHRFCLVSHGDDPATHKMAEMMAIAALGGCLPVVATSTDARDHLPYAEDVDYCQVAYLLSPLFADNLPKVLGRLGRVTADDAAKRHARAAALRDMFVFRDGASAQRPSAAHHIIANMCAHARRVRAAAGCGKREDAPPSVQQSKRRHVQQWCMP